MDAGIPQTNKIQNKGLELPTRGSRRLITPCLTVSRCSLWQGLWIWLQLLGRLLCRGGVPKDLLRISTCPFHPVTHGRIYFPPASAIMRIGHGAKPIFPPKPRAGAIGAGASGPIGAPAWSARDSEPLLERDSSHVFYDQPCDRN